MLLKKILLFPFAVIYGIITAFRNFLYDWKILPSKSFEVHTICVGNLAVGGTGKTPHVEYLINLLKNEMKLAVLSRGYKRKSTGFIHATNSSSVEDIGDEPLLYKTKNPDLDVCVDGNRVNGVKKILDFSQPPKVIILDDAFQHRALNCELKIVISEYTNLFLNDCMMPSGYLRESKKGINRADIIIISKTPERTSAIEMRNMSKDLKPLGHQQIFFTWLKYGELYGFQNPNETIDTLNDLFRYRIILFTGIGNPTPMVTYLREYSSYVKHIQYSDHHQFTLKDINDIREELDAIEGGNKIVITTEKDAMRLRTGDLQDMANTLPLYVLPIEVDFKDKTQEFNETIINYVRTNKFYHKKYS
ncbi:MAG: tetraacyldisaccharide 4'-kinase [Burkholderiales bacterium]|nr:tetraacyldisaccharide 4'-kinase [Bacteroidia bacterium]